MEPDTLLRLDKWLWHARFFKSRTLAAKHCASGRMRLDGAIVHKPHHQVRAGNVLTFPLGPHVRVIKVLALGTRRGPAPEARQLYEDLAPPQPAAPAEPSAGQRPRGSGRPTKADRRAIERLQGRKIDPR
jgi:ribosome-associated heat shock protein Hsp15